ncbi:hypothetical protein GQ44DRAFT_701563 [Phaeosphaeriaceae sp. PMI808]|nr:hypothetical protein GQ44DRAFT_701563 [Phaeosphaeriaceae sp. PMI808]
MKRLPSTLYLIAPRTHTFTPLFTRAMSSTPPPPKSTPLPLPEPSKDNNNNNNTPTTTIDMSNGGSAVKLDHLGPLVVNKDGTLSRISNWAQMADIEKENTMRILGRRNEARREALREKMEGG